MDRLRQTVLHFLYYADPLNFFQRSDRELRLAVESSASVFCSGKLERNAPHISNDSVAAVTQNRLALPTIDIFPRLSVENWKMCIQRCWIYFHNHDKCKLLSPFENRFNRFTLPNVFLILYKRWHLTILSDWIDASFVWLLTVYMLQCYNRQKKPFESVGVFDSWNCITDVLGHFELHNIDRYDFCSILHRIHTQIACSHEYFSPLLVSEENLNSSESCYCVIPERVPYISRLVWQSVYQLMFTLYAFCQNKIKIIVISCFSSSSMHASHWKIFWKICSVIDCLSSLASNHSTIAKKSRRNGIPIRPIEWCLCKNIVRENLRQEENRCQRDWEVKPHLYLVYDFSANSNVFIIQDGARVQQC